MNVFVSGATGYLGRALTRRLLADGHAVTALVRSPARARELEQLGARLVVADIGDACSVLPPGTEAIVHAAFSLFPASDYRTNVIGSSQLIRAARALPIKRFVFTSSSLVYGPNDPRQPVDETSPCSPNTRFARQQREVELLLLRLAADERFPAVILRPSELWGGEGGFFDSTVQRMRAGQFVVADAGLQPLSLTELADLVDIIARVLVSPLAPGEIFNVCTPAAVPIGALYDAIAAALGVRPPRRLPVALIYAAAALLQSWGLLSGTQPPINLEIARLARFYAGTRRIDKARELLGFEPRHHDPLGAIAAFYAARRRAEERRA